MAKTLGVLLTTIAIAKGLQSVTQGLDLNINNFGFRLLYNTHLEVGSNSVVSTYGIWTLMASIAQGAEESGYAQLARALHLPWNKRDYNALVDNSKICLEQIRIPSKDVAFNGANFIFTDMDVHLKQEFKDTVQFSFNTLAVTLQFNRFYESAATANDNINYATQGQIVQELLPSDFFEMRKEKMILTNAVSFSGLWKMPFDAKRTQLESFYNEHGIKIGEVKMMKETARFHYADIEEIGASVIEMPYGDDDRFAMVIMDPHTGISVQELCNKFTSVSFKEIYAKLKSFVPSSVTLWLPRFQITTKVALDRPLMKLGVFDIFNSSRANFKSLSDTNMFVSEVLQKAQIEVIETGNKDWSPPDEYIDIGFLDRFTAHKPFLYVIVEKISSVVLLGGIYSTPIVF